jgi:hypothetical protein
MSIMHGMYNSKDSNCSLYIYIYMIAVLRVLRTCCFAVDVCHTCVYFLQES